MMEHIEQFQGVHGCPIQVREWYPPEEVKGVVHILHGMAEHSARYRSFAAFLAEAGFAVWAHDHRQHGYSLGHDVCGIFDRIDTWEAMVEDVAMVQKELKDVYPDKPIFMLGHSMGSIALRSYLQTGVRDLRGVVIMDTPTAPKALLLAGMGFAQVIGAWHYYKPSPFLNELSVGKYNKSVGNPSTPFDWISHDEEKVKEFASDPLCGFVYNPKFYKELSRGVLQANDPKYMSRFPKIPMCMISGQADPAGHFGHGVKAVSDRYRSLGVDHQLQLVKGMRHEVLNEVNREGVYKSVLDFMLTCL